MNLALKRWQILLAMIFAFAALVTSAFITHISSSEFWPVTLSKEIWAHNSIEAGVYFKPVFHALLSTLFLFPFSSHVHVLAARFMFATLATGSISLFVIWLKKLDLIRATVASFILIFFLLLSPLFFSQIIKIRSDMLSLFFSLSILSFITTRKLPLKNVEFLFLTFLNLLLLGSTPRAIFHELVVLSFVLPWHWQQLKNKKTREQFFVAFGTPIFSFCLFFFPIGSVFGMHLLDYLKNSYDTITSWFFIKSWMKTEPALCLIIFFSFIILVFKFRSFDRRQRLITWPFLFSLFGLGVADLKTSYLLVSFFPFLLLPVILVFSRYKNLLSLSLGGFAIILSHALLTHQFDWGGSNTNQFIIIDQVTGLLDKNPNYIFFDGLGILPRANQMLGYLGPFDETAIDSIWTKLKSHPPDVILYSSRFELLGNEFVSFVQDRYDQPAPELFVRKSLGTGKDIQFRQMPIFLFGLSPGPDQN